jgi:hypothetical protein
VIQRRRAASTSAPTPDTNGHCDSAVAPGKSTTPGSHRRRRSRAMNVGFRCPMAMRSQQHRRRGGRSPDQRRCAGGNGYRRPSAE